MNNCLKCGCELDATEACCPGCLSQMEGLVDALKRIAAPDDLMWPGTNLNRLAMKRIATEALKPPNDKLTDAGGRERPN